MHIIYAKPQLGLISRFLILNIITLTLLKTVCGNVFKVYLSLTVEAEWKMKSYMQGRKNDSYFDLKHDLGSLNN